MNLADEIEELGRRSRAAARQLAIAPRAAKDAALEAVAAAIEANAERVLAANAADVEAAAHRGVAEAMLDRLRLDATRLAKIARQVRDVVQLPDPVGEVLRAWSPPSGIRIEKRRVPIGTIGIIFESRPNVTIDAAALCLKTGNATILRGGSEALHSNLALAECLRTGLGAAGLPADGVQLIGRTEREAVKLLAQLDRWLDVIIPRGGEALIRTVVEHARMPVIKHYTGLCILYVDAAADLPMAARLAVDAKVRRPGVCNAIETLLVHRAVAPDWLPVLGAEMRAHGVELRADPAAQALLGAECRLAEEADWDTEFLDLRLAVKVVDSLDEALEHIQRHGSHHSDAIVTRDPATAERFLNEVDSATVYWNASTRFTDGGEFGFGAEIGISTDKLHARGPMGLEELTTYKYLIRGTGEVRG
ncbi:MAG: glutamate-5-semialdehyde dehydrogenase [Verrucomicrobia bacterium]|nr:glutamate-5-semialdehyde dehydrogenase [Verrucomicrobiota bacterium]